MNQMEAAVSILGAGGLVAFPTETVYGLGADAANEAAVARVFAVKGRPTAHPLIVHLHNQSELSFWAQDIADQALLLAAHFWPGPLTLVLRKAAHVLPIVTGGQETVALRVPAHPLAQQLLRAYGSGLVAPSANLFTQVSPTTASAVRDELGDQIDMILDGGACPVGLESTIIDMTGDTPVLLRPGMISQAMLAAVLQQPIATKTTTVRAPGMHHLHYAPRTQASLLTLAEIKAQWSVGPVAVLTFSKLVDLPATAQHIVMPPQVEEYARMLYYTLREVDKGAYRHILIENVPADATWDAVRDRLMKATARRD